jgi:thymidylate synthase (FAD)
MTVKKADEEYIKAEERQFLGKEVGDMFVEPENQLADYSSIKVELTNPIREGAYEDWVNSAFYNALATWDREPQHVVSEMHENATLEEKENLLFGILKDRPISVALEGISFSYKITGVPRSMTAQICRHRNMAYGEMSMRVASAYSEPVRVPNGLNPQQQQEYENIVKDCKLVYKRLIQSGVPMEQARNILPLGTLTKIGVTTTLRFLIDYVRGRTSGITQDEHTYIVCLLLKEIREKQPKFYDIIISKCPNAEELMEEYFQEYQYNSEQVNQ